MDTAAFQQISFVGVRDNGDEANSTSIVSSSSTLTDDINSDWTQLVDTNFRVRFVIRETASIALANFKEVWQYNVNSSGWFNITVGGAVINSVASSQYSGPVDTTQRLGSGTFLTSNSGLIESDAGPGSALEPDFAGSDEVEFENCLQLDSTNISDGDTVEIKITNNGTDIATYTETPTITASAPSGDGPIQDVISVT